MSYDTHASRGAMKCKKCRRYHRGECVVTNAIKYRQQRGLPPTILGDPDRDGRDTRGLASAIGMMEVM